MLVHTGSGACVGCVSGRGYRGAAAAGIETGTGTNVLGRTRIDERLTWRSAGASAATIATVLTHPFDAVKVRTSACHRSIGGGWR